MKKTTPTFRSSSPVSSALDILGDRWSLLIVRDCVYFAKSTFSEFLSSDEHIARNVLATRLAMLESVDIVFKVECPDDHRTKHYFLTEKGQDLIPTLVELTTWGATHIGTTRYSQEWQAMVTADRTRAIACAREAVIRGDGVFAGEQPALDMLRQALATPDTI